MKQKEVIMPSAGAARLGCGGAAATRSHIKQGSWREREGGRQAWTSIAGNSRGRVADELHHGADPRVQRAGACLVVIIL